MATTDFEGFVASLAAPRALKEWGYVRIPGVLSPDETEKYLGLANDLFERVGTHPLYEGHADHVYNVARNTRLFDPLFEHPLVMETLGEVLGHDFTLSQTELRRPIRSPKSGSANEWHRDSRHPAPGLWVAAFWPLEPVTLDNGPTYVSPGSHRRKDDELSDPVPLTADAGDLILMDANLLHVASLTVDGTSRWILICTYNRWFLKPALDHTHVVYPNHHGVSQLSPSLRQLFGFTSIPPRDERKRTHTCRPWEEIVKEL